MKNKIVAIPSIKQPIQASPGFAKKKLSDYKLDIMGLCGFGCRYCSSNEGNYLRINRARFTALTNEQLGVGALPSEDPALTFVWPDVLGRLEAQLAQRPKNWGNGKTLVFSMLTDGFSPLLVKRGITEQVLKAVVEKTSFRIRVLTKNAVVGTSKWLKFFAKHSDRFVVGLSIGTLDDSWARQVEIGTSSPSARLRALNRLQRASIPTYGMLCPMFPDLLEGDSLDRLVELIQPKILEHVWGEPYNDRNNWQIVRDGYPRDSKGYVWMTNVFQNRRTELWSEYATRLYCRLRIRAENGGWLHKLRYLLYEQAITATDALAFRDLHGVLLQSARGSDGNSQNPHIARVQCGAP